MTDSGTLTAPRVLTRQKVVSKEESAINHAIQPIENLENLSLRPCNYLTDLNNVVARADIRIKRHLNRNEDFHVDQSAYKAIRKCNAIMTAAGANNTELNNHASLAQIHFSLYSFEVQMKTDISSLPGQKLIQLSRQIKSIPDQTKLSGCGIEVTKQDVLERLTNHLQAVADIHLNNPGKINHPWHVTMTTLALGLLEMDPVKNSSAIYKNKLKLEDILHTGNNELVRFLPTKYKSASTGDGITNSRLNSSLEAAVLIRREMKQDPIAQAQEIAEAIKVLEAKFKLVMERSDKSEAKSIAHTALSAGRIVDTAAKGLKDLVSTIR